MYQEEADILLEVIGEVHIDHYASVIVEIRTYAMGVPKIAISMLVRGRPYHGRIKRMTASHAKSLAALLDEASSYIFARAA